MIPSVINTYRSWLPPPSTHETESPLTPPPTKTHPPPHLTPGYTPFTPLRRLRNLFSHHHAPQRTQHPIPQTSQFAHLSSLPPSPIPGESANAERGFRLLLEEFSARDKDLKLNAYARLWFRMTIPLFLGSRRCVLEWVAGRKGIEEVEIRRPVVVTGLHRTGSTLLHRLLSLCPETRTTTPIDTWGGIPNTAIFPPHASRKDQLSSPRAESWAKTFTQWRQSAPQHFWSSMRNHRFDYREPEEELLFMALAGKFSMLSHLLPPTSPYVDWCTSPESQKPTYTLLKRCIQSMHQAWAPESHWTLKAPEHALYIENLLAEFPDARIVVTNRDVVDVVRSTCRFYADDLLSYVHALSLPKIGASVMHQTLAKHTRLTRYRTFLSLTNPTLHTSQFLDVHYDDLTRDPIDTLRHICAHHGVEISAEWEERVGEWLREDGRLRVEEEGAAEREGVVLGKRFELGEFGLCEEGVRRAFWEAGEVGRLLGVRDAEEEVRGKGGKVFEKEE
ncbi:hypothetical protein HDV00_000415 [Rhizophlyctis rosea]|nr:hypothetical protein HDV00_000415 [Rhizophlyctis rosea]